MGTWITIQTERIAGECRQGAASGTATIAYEKSPNEELWLRRPGRMWERPNLFQVIGKPDANERGNIHLAVLPGEEVEAGIFVHGAGPTSLLPVCIGRETATG